MKIDEINQMNQCLINEGIIHLRKRVDELFTPSPTSVTVNDLKPCGPLQIKAKDEDG